VREANRARPPIAHPGDFEGWSGRTHDLTDALTAVGASVVRVPDAAEAASWLGDFCADFASVAVGRDVPAAVVPGHLERMDAAEAEVAISAARLGVAETGSVVLDSRDGRRTQLLAPTHVVLLSGSTVHATLRGALREVAGDLPAALGLHSGPSKSADIGQVMVEGVHGPGRLVVLLVEAW
jgi:L-lactate dehydrogenase complex protein LldG